LPWVSEDTLDLDFWAVLVRLWELLEMDWMLFALRHGNEPFGAKGRILCFNLKCSPKAHCSRFGCQLMELWGNDWIMRALTSSMNYPLMDSEFDGIVGRWWKPGGGM
jgi:hypothetical protein